MSLIENSIPFTPPSWQPSDVPPLSQYVHELVLRPHFDPFTHRRTWQLDIPFTGFLTRMRHPPTDKPCRPLRHQTAEWSVVRLEDFAMVVKNILNEWDSLCCMHALCYHVISNPGNCKLFQAVATITSAYQKMCRTACLPCGNRTTNLRPSIPIS